METLLATFKLLLMIAIPLAAFVTGLRVTDPFWLWKRPRLLVRSLLAVLLVVPLVDLVLVELLRPPVLIRAGIVVAILSIGVAPPQTLKRTREAGARVAYEVGLDVVLLTLAIVYIPAALALHGAIFDHGIRLNPLDVAQVAFVQMLVPLALGIAFARRMPHRVEVVGRHAAKFVNVVLLIVVVFALGIAWRSLIGLGPVAWLTCAVAAASAIVVGHLFGMGEPAIRRPLVAFSVLRFPGLAFLILAAVPRGERLIPVVLAYILTSALLLAVYYAASSARARRKRPAPLQPVARP